MSVDSAWRVLHERVYDVIEEMCSVREFRFSKDKQKWMSYDLNELMKDRDRALKLYIDKQSMQKS